MRERNILIWNMILLKFAEYEETFFVRNLSSIFYLKNYLGQLTWGNCYAGDNYPGANCPEGNYLGEIVVGNFPGRAIVLGSIFLEAIIRGSIFLGVVIQGSNCPRTLKYRN